MGLQVQQEEYLDTEAISEPQAVNSNTMTQEPALLECYDEAGLDYSFSIHTSFLWADNVARRG